jgi:hypothetical protein
MIEAVLGVFEDPLQIGGPDVQCPVCGEHSPASWMAYHAPAPGGGFIAALPRGRDRREEVSLDWMRCGNEDCQQLIVRVHEAHVAITEGLPFMNTESWIARPRFGQSRRRLDPLISDSFRRDYQEAAALLDISPRMSAVLSRSILADLLKKYAKLDDFKLSDRIDKFRANTKYPSNLRENVHHFREIADFGAHTQKSDQDVVIEVDREGAEWLLDVLDRAFEHFIVAPERDRKMRERWDENLAQAGRKPIPPLPEEEES